MRQLNLCRFSTQNCSGIGVEMGYTVLENSNDTNKTGSVVPTLATKLSTVLNLSIVELPGTIRPTVASTTPQSPHPGTSHILAYVLVPLGSLILIAVLSFLVSISSNCVVCHVIASYKKNSQGFQCTEK